MHSYNKNKTFGSGTKKCVLKNNLISTREKEVLTLYAQGLTYNQIADEMTLSPLTIRKHIENIYKKLQVHNKMEAVQKGLKFELI